MTVIARWTDEGHTLRVSDTDNPDAWVESDMNFEDVNHTPVKGDA